MMKKNGGILMSILVIVLVVAVAATAVYAWFTGTANFSNIVIKTGNVRCEADLYYYRDFNIDGFPDILPIAGLDRYIAISETHGYEEIAITEAKSQLLKPGNCYFYRLIIRNIGSINGKLYVKLELGDLSRFAPYLSHKSTMELTPAVISERETDRKIFLDSDGYLTFPADIIIPVNGEASIWFGLKFEPLPAGASNASFQSIDMSKLQIHVILEQLAEEAVEP